MDCICCGAILTLVQFQLFLCFVLIIIHYHTQKKKGNVDIETRIKLYQMYIILHKSAYKLKL